MAYFLWSVDHPVYRSWVRNGDEIVLYEYMRFQFDSLSRRVVQSSRFIMKIKPGNLKDRVTWNLVSRNLMWTSTWHRQIRRQFRMSPAIFARDSIYAVSAHMLSQFRPTVGLSVRLSVCLSGARVIHAKTVEVRIIWFSPYSSPIPLVFAR